MADPNHDPSHWEFVRDDVFARTPIFSVLRRRLRHGAASHEDDFYVVDAFDWVAVLPVTADGKLVLVRQFRFGSQSFTWEVPAGTVDEGENPLEAGVRELTEETGYTGENTRLLGKNIPNPAFQDNTCYFVLMENCRQIAAPQWEGHEEMEIREVPVDEALDWARCGRITHSMVQSAFFLLEPWWREQNRPT